MTGIRSSDHSPSLPSTADAATPAAEPTALAPRPDTQDTTPAVQAQLLGDGLMMIRGAATIHNAAALHAQLSQLDSKNLDRLSIDLSGLHSMDTAGAQQLIALRRACRRSSIHSCPDSVRRFLELTGLTILLTDEVH